MGNPPKKMVIPYIFYWHTGCHRLTGSRPQQDGDRFQQTKGSTVAALALAIDGLQRLQDVFAAQLAER